MERQGDGITRRDFLDGVAISAAGLAAAAAAPHLTGAEAALAAHGHKPPKPLPPGYHPPTETGLKGIRDDVVKQTIRIDGLPNQRDVHSTRGGPGIHAFPHDDHEITYDCVIVGAGASPASRPRSSTATASAHDSKILLLDPLRDFGGHSHRNEFHIGDTTILRNGGTVNLDTVATWNEPAGGLLDIPGEYGQPALDMLEFCGVDWENFPEHDRTEHPELLRPAARCCSSLPEDWGRDYVVPNRVSPGAVAHLPRAHAVQRRRPRSDRPHPDRRQRSIPIEAKHGPKSDQEKKGILSRLTYRRWLMAYMGANEQAMHPVSAARPQPARRGGPGRLGRRHVGARKPRLPRH